MLNALFRFSDYFQYLITSKGRHGLHSPFAYNFYEHVIRGKATSPLFDMIEIIRSKMIRSKSKIEFIDLGTGNHSGLRSLSEIASNTAKSAKHGRLLFRIVKAFQPEFSLELGTGSGIATLYQAAALNPGLRLHTIEGSESLTKIAGFNAEQCGLTEAIDFNTGDFAVLLPQILNQMPRLDYAFIDGNHSYNPTLDYFEACLPLVHENSVLIFDDIYWSEDMKRAWNVIKNHERVTVSMDLYQFGIVFFRTGQEKENFIIRY